MPFNDNLPAENTDPWYSPLSVAWNNLKAFVNGLETTLGTKATSADLTSGLATKVNSSTFTSGMATKENVLTAGANVTINRSDPANPVISASGGGGGGAVDSVNGQTGVVNLDAADVGAATEAFVDEQIQLIDFPVDSVNGQQGSVILDATDVGAAPVVSAPNRVYATDGSGAQASRPATDFATSAQGAKADTAVQPAAMDTAIAAAITALDMDSVARTVLVVTGTEVRPDADVVLWADFREGEVSDPINMTGNDFRFRPRSVGPTPIAPVITTTALAALTEGTATSQTLAATGTTPITWSVTAGTLPAGLILSAGGLLSGTPTTEGAYSFTATATNSAGADSQPYSGTVGPPSPSSGMSIFGSSTPGTGATIENDGGGSLIIGARFYATKAIRAIGLRVWNPPGADGTFLGTDLTAYAYPGNWDGSVAFGPIDGTPAQTKVHTDTRVAGTWTDILFDAPVALVAISETGAEADFVTLAVQYAGGNYYVGVTGIPDASTVPSPEDADVTLAEGSFRRSVNSLSSSSTSLFYGIDMIFEVV